MYGRRGRSSNYLGMSANIHINVMKHTDEAADFRSVAVNFSIVVCQLSQLGALVHHVEHIGEDVDFFHPIWVKLLYSVKVFFSSFKF